MNPQKGYYSLIQFCPDLEKSEAANIGVMLFCPEMQFLKALTVSNNSRVIKFFGTSEFDLDRLNVMKRGFEDRIANATNDIRSLEDLHKFISTRANQLQITTPRPMRVIDPQQDLEAAFERIFGRPVRVRPRTSLKQYVEKKIIVPDLRSRVLTDIDVEVPVLAKRVEIPFGYQNGRFNLITPVRFEAANADSSARTACKYAVEGNSLFEHPHSEFGDLQLVVIGRFRKNDKQTPQIVKRIFAENSVKLVNLTDIDKLTDDIRRHGKEINK